MTAPPKLPEGWEEMVERARKQYCRGDYEPERMDVAFSAIDALKAELATEREAAALAFECCGGNDGHPKSHTADCDRMDMRNSESWDGLQSFSVKMKSERDALAAKAGALAAENAALREALASVSQGDNGPAGLYWCADSACFHIGNPNGCEMCVKANRALFSSAGSDFRARIRDEVLEAVVNVVRDSISELHAEDLECDVYAAGILAAVEDRIRALKEKS